MHKTQRIAIKTADIDEKMIPVVEWLNSYDSVVTFFCCQGKGGQNPESPYVMFSCYETEDLMEILKVLRNHPFKVRCEIDWILEHFPLRHRIVFEDTKTLKRFTAWSLCENALWRSRL